MRVFLLLATASFGEKARQDFDDEMFLFVVELLPQTRLRDGDVGEAQIQLRHGPPGLLQMLLVSRDVGKCQ